MTPQEFETKVRKLYGIPLDYDLDSVPDDTLYSVIHGHGFEGEYDYFAGISEGYNTEGAHEESDKMLLDLITELGFGNAARIINNTRKWFA